MVPLHSACITTPHGEKTISVFVCDILNFDEEIDILTTSAFVRSYAPTPKTVFGALSQVGISVAELARSPLIDLRHFCNTWLSREIYSSFVRIRRIGCVELNLYSKDQVRFIDSEQAMLNSIKSYFQMLDIASTYGVKMDTVALPLLGAGNQKISASLTMIPILNECVSLLKRNEAVSRICFIERNQAKAELIASAVKNSYMIAQANSLSVHKDHAMQKKAYAFISYASGDKNIADNLCARLEREGVKVWYAPRDVRGPYAAAISDAISKATHFIVILSQNSMHSEHVLNEIDLAFQGLPDKIKFKPLRIDESLFTSSFRYYLSRQHWMDAIVPPLEERLDEFVAKFMSDT